MLKRENNLTGYGSAYDRGSADRYYRRTYAPHYFIGASHASARVTADKMTPEELEAYKRGWQEQTEFKEWD